MKLMTAFIFSLLLGTLSAFADHPNEGGSAIEQLIIEAEQNSFELKQMEQNLKASQQLVSSQFGRYSPEISLEGGPQSTRFDNQKNSGTAVYGKAEWNIYKGGADSAELKKAQLDRDLQKKKLEAVKSKIRRDVKKTYYEMLFILESIALKQRAVALNDEQKKLANAKRTSGFTSRTDVIEFELRGSSLESDLLLLAQEKEQKSQELSLLLSRKDNSLPIEVKGHLTRASLQYDQKKLTEELHENNIELTESLNQASAAELDSRIARSELLPKVDLEARYGKLAIEEEVFDDKNNYSLQLKVSVPLFSGFENLNSTRHLKSKAVSLRLGSDQKRLLMTAALDSTLKQIKMLNQRLDIEEKSLSRSEEYYKLTLSEYRRGVKNSPDMVGASERLLDVRIRNLQYRRDLMIADLKIQELTNSR